MVRLSLRCCAATRSSSDPKDLLEIAEQGRHAASDYIEDALLGRVPTVGCRRCGGGIAGGVELSNVPRGVEMSNELPGDITLLEGSGAAIPPAFADSTILVIPASVDPEYLTRIHGALSTLAIGPGGGYTLREPLRFPLPDL